MAIQRGPNKTRMGKQGPQTIKESPTQGSKPCTGWRLTSWVAALLKKKRESWLTFKLKLSGSYDSKLHTAL